MKTLPKSKNVSSNFKAKVLTFGDLIAETYRACGKRRASNLLQLAIESNLIRFE